MEKKQVFLLIGCDEHGIHTEVTAAHFGWEEEALRPIENIYEAVLTFAQGDIGPIHFSRVADEMVVSGEIEGDDKRFLETCIENGTVPLDYIDLFKRVYDAISARIIDTATTLFNFGPHASDDCDTRRVGNYVAEESVSQWRIYRIDADLKLCIYPKAASRSA